MCKFLSKSGGGGGYRFKFYFFWGDLTWNDPSGLLNTCSQTYQRYKASLFHLNVLCFLFLMEKSILYAKITISNFFFIIQF